MIGLAEVRHNKPLVPTRNSIALLLRHSGGFGCLRIHAVPERTRRKLVRTYPASAKAGGGYVWDEVLEYRVWCHPERGAPDEADGSDYYYAFATYEDA